MSVTEPPAIAELVRETRQMLKLTPEQFALKLGVLLKVWILGRTDCIDSPKANFENAILYGQVRL